MSYRKGLVSIVVPVYNSSPTLPRFLAAVETALANNMEYELILVDDHSTDSSWQAITHLCVAHRHITGIRLSENHGQWCATLAGMSRSSGEYIVTIDDDLEYQPADIAVLYDYIRQAGFKVVFGIAAGKYKLQGRSTLLARWRNAMLNAIWNKPMTDSFRILYRDVVFDGDEFRVNEHLESFLKHHLPEQLWGYTSVSYQKRQSGASNHHLGKKIKLFFLFSFHYVKRSHKKLEWSIAEVISSCL